MTKKQFLKAINLRIDTEAEKYFDEVFGKQIKDFAEARRVNPNIKRKQHIQEMLNCFKKAEDECAQELAESLNTAGLLELE